MEMDRFWTGTSKNSRTRSFQKTAEDLLVRKEFADRSEVDCATSLPLAAEVTFPRVCVRYGALSVKVLASI